MTILPTPATLEWISHDGAQRPSDHRGCLRLIDQTQLPGQLVFVDCHDVPTLFEAIRTLRVRGAPAIGVAAAYGVCLAAGSLAESPWPAWHAGVQAAIDSLATSRPTAVNLFWALERMRQVLERLAAEHALSLTAGEPLAPPVAARRLLAEARTIHEEDAQMCRAIGTHGAPLLRGVQGVLTHCNAGALATAGEGTALSVIYAAHRAGERFTVYADETRPLLQGARLTAWELQAAGIPVTVICDSMAAQVMRAGRVGAVIVGADRIAASGDVANKIGTYGVALLAKAHGVPCYVAAPSSTFDLSLPDGEAIEIEQRGAEEVAGPAERRSVPEGVAVYNPAFDVTPASLVSAIVCEHGVIQPVDHQRIAAMLSGR